MSALKGPKNARQLHDLLMAASPDADNGSEPENGEEKEKGKGGRKNIDQSFFSFFFFPLSWKENGELSPFVRREDERKGRKLSLS